MKDFIATIVVFTVFIALIPCLVFVTNSKPSNSATTLQEEVTSTVKIYFTQEQECKSFSIEEYVIGSVFAQMPADFHKEALKAQCVLANTYVKYREKAEKLCPTENLKGAILSDDENFYQGFFTKTQAKEFYQDGYEEAYKRIKSAYNEVKGMTLCYKNEPVIVAFHAVSSGHTASAKDAWDEEISYLQSCESPFDKEIDGVKSKISITSQELKNKLQKEFEIDFDSVIIEDDWIKISNTADNGYVKTVTVCDKELSASDFTTTLGISSPCFTVSYENDIFTFVSLGWGHLVGLSQYGANSMASEGSDFKEILLHYYTDCEIT